MVRAHLSVERGGGKRDAGRQEGRMIVEERQERQGREGRRGRREEGVAERRDTGLEHLGSKPPPSC